MDLIIKDQKGQTVEFVKDLLGQSPERIEELRQKYDHFPIISHTIEFEEGVHMGEIHDFSKVKDDAVRSIAAILKI